MELSDVFDQIFDDAAKTKGLSRQQLTDRAGLHRSAISRCISTGDCRFSTLNKLLSAGGFKLVVVPDNDNAEKLARGNLF
jgi:DNA-binding phage protein